MNVVCFTALVSPDMQCLNELCLSVSVCSHDFYMDSYPVPSILPHMSAYMFFFFFFPHSVLQHASYLSELERKHYEMMYLKKWSLSLCVLADASRISPCGKLTKSIVKEGGGFFHSEEHLGGKKFLWNIKLIRFYVFFLN